MNSGNFGGIPQTEDVEKFLLLYTEIPSADCKKYGSLKGSKINEAKILLANKVTELCHGKEASELASKTATNVFRYGEADENLPTKLISKKDLEPDIGIVQLYIISGLVKSGKEAKRLIKENGARLNDELVKSPDLRLNPKNFNNFVKLSLGKKNHLLVKMK